MIYRMLPVAMLLAAAFFMTGVQYAHAEPGLDVFHQVDAQLTFWEGMHGQADGPLATAGTREMAANVALLARLAHVSRGIKSISSQDVRFPSEGRIYSKIGVPGPVGPDRIPEAVVYSRAKQVLVPHHREQDGKLELVPYDPEKIRAEILDPGVEIVIEKNGFPAYDVFKNPRTEKIYSILKPKRVFVYGVATDWCVDGAVNSLVDRGYEVYVVTDAVAGVDPVLSRQKIDAMVKRGVKLVTTREVLGMFPADARRIDRSPRGVPGCDWTKVAPPQL